MFAFISLTLFKQYLSVIYFSARIKELLLICFGHFYLIKITCKKSPRKKIYLNNCDLNEEIKSVFERKFLMFDLRT